MKKLILFYILTFVISQMTFSQEYGWKDISANIPDFPFDTTYNISGDTLVASLTDVYFINDNEGWITTWHPHGDSAAILHTTDGGETFEVQITPLGATIAIHMLDSENGYSGGDGGWVYKTDDGGLNWNMLASIGTVLDISFPPNTLPGNPVGYASGDNGNVWKISSILTNLNSPSSSTLRGISAPSVDNVWVCGGNRIYYYNGTDFISQIAPSGTFNDIHFVNNLKGWVVGNSGIIGYTSDGGATWIRQTNPDPQDRSLYGVFFYDEGHGWATGVDGLILHTSDGGTNWAIVGEGLSTEGLGSVHFTSPTNGYVAGGNKTLLKYTEVSGIGEDIIPMEFELFPNPVKGRLQIKCSDFKAESGIIEILSIDGKVILRREIGQGNENIKIDASHLETGMYLCKISTDKKSTTKKFIIE